VVGASIAVGGTAVGCGALVGAVAGAAGVAAGAQAAKPIVSTINKALNFLKLKRVNIVISSIVNVQTERRLAATSSARIDRIITIQPAEQWVMHIKING
jgi:hypothetical protein